MPSVLSGLECVVCNDICAHQAIDADERTNDLCINISPLSTFTLLGTRPYAMVRHLVIHPEAIAAHDNETFTRPECGTGLSWKTLTSATKTRTDTFTSGIATCAPSSGCLEPHRHQQAELYHFIEGQGIVEMEGSEYPVRAGSVVFIPSNVKHAVRNSSETKELRWLFVFATGDFGDVVYRWSRDEEGPARRVEKAKL